MLDGATSPHAAPPRRRYAVWRQRRTPAVVAIVALNVVVFLGWQAAGSVPGMARFMATNFLASTRHLEYGYPWTLLTATFSHQELWHLAINMFVLWNFGTILERLWGTAAFVTFYLVAAVTSSVSHCAVSSLYIGDGTINGLGASGAVAGLLLAFAFHFPRHRILLFGLMPLPALGGALAFIGLDLWGLLAQGAGGGLPIGHGAHLGGSFAGAVAYLAYFRHHVVMRE